MEVLVRKSSLPLCPPWFYSYFLDIPKVGIYKESDAVVAARMFFSSSVSCCA
ncbi:hypothetical protein R84B8_01211 [Treponema sp. R8-4-B8]